MKKVMLLGLILAVGMVFNAYAADEAKLVQVPNKICPISHEKVGENGMQPHQVTHNGKTYNLCCSMCEKDFNKDPDKYAKMMEDEVAQTQAEEAKKM